MGWKENKQKHRKEAEKRSGGGVNRWKPSPGVNKIILIPGYSRDGVFIPNPFVKRGAHFNSPNGEIVNCRNASLGKACKLCEAWRAAKNGEGEEEDLETCRVAISYSCCILDANDREAGVQVWDAPTTVFRELMDMLDDPSVYPQESAMAVMHKNPIIRFKNNPKADPNNKYAGFRAEKRVKMKLSKYKKLLPDLKALASGNLPTYEDTVKAYEGEPLRDDDGGKKRKKKGKKKKLDTKRKKGKKKRSRR